MSEKVCRVGLVAYGKEGAGIPEVGFVKELRAQIERVTTDFTAYRADVEPMLEELVLLSGGKLPSIYELRQLFRLVSASRVCKEIKEGK